MHKNLFLGSSMHMFDWSKDKKNKKCFQLFAVSCLILLPSLHLNAEQVQEDAIQTKPIVVESTLALSESETNELTHGQLNDEEAFFVRRIAEFWKDGDFLIVKKQVEEFLDLYPNSSLADYFWGILGDLNLQEHQTQAALDCYSNITKDLIKQKVIINKLHCYYELGEYEQIVDEGLPYLSVNSKEFQQRKHELHFLIAEGLFRKALSMEEKNTQRQELVSKARPLYENLAETPYDEVSKFALAETHRILENYQLAADLFLDLAQTHPKEREELLFQAASMHSKFDEKQAIDTFTEVIQLGGSKQGQALYNRFVLLFQTGAYRSVIADYEELENKDNPYFDATFDYIVGKSYYSLEQYQESIRFLDKFIASQNDSSEQLKNALMLKMSSAQQIGETNQLAQALEKFKEAFPADRQLPNALFMYAVQLKRTNALEEAGQIFAEIEEKYPDFTSQESYLFESGFLAHQNKQWERSYETMNDFLQRYPESLYREQALKVQFSSALHMVENADSSYTKQMFLSDLREVLNEQDLFSSEEETQYQLLYAKTLYELGKYRDSYDYLMNSLMNSLDESDGKNIAQAYYLAALNLFEEQSDHKLFCSHLEHALKLDPDTFDCGTTHLHLFNGFTITAENIEASDQKKALYQKAAMHLDRALEHQDQEILVENKLWLANHYYFQIKNYIDENWSHSLHDDEALSALADRSVELFETVLLEDNRVKTITEDTLFLEPEALKLAELYEWKNQKQEKLNVVASLLEQQSAHEEYEWTFKRHTLFELAKTYKEMNDREKALETFNYISTFTTNLPTQLSCNAALEVASLKFSLLSQREKEEKSDSLIGVLNQLKELQIRKNPHSEPVHLESALEYAAIRSDLSSEQEKAERSVFFLERIKDDYSLKSETLPKEYLAALESSAQVKEIYHAYMLFIDAEIARQTAQMRKKEENFNEMEEYNERALALLNELKLHPHLPKQLVSRIDRSVDAINSSNTY